MVTPSPPPLKRPGPDWAPPPREIGGAARPLLVVQRRTDGLTLRAYLGTAASGLQLRVLLGGNGDRDHHGGLVSTRMQASYLPNAMKMSKLSVSRRATTERVAIKRPASERRNRTWRPRVHASGVPLALPRRPTLRGLFALSDVGERERKREKQSYIRPSREAGKEGGKVLFGRREERERGREGE